MNDISYTCQGLVGGQLFWGGNLHICAILYVHMHMCRKHVYSNYTLLYINGFLINSWECSFTRTRLHNIICIGWGGVWGGVWGVGWGVGWVDHIQGPLPPNLYKSWLYPILCTLQFSCGIYIHDIRGWLFITGSSAMTKHGCLRI